MSLFWVCITTKCPESEAGADDEYFLVARLMWSVLCEDLDLESRFDNAIGLHGGDGDIEHPEEDESSWWNGLEELGSSQLSTHSRMSSGNQDQDGKTSLDTEDSHWESQAENSWR